MLLNIRCKFYPNVKKIFYGSCVVLLSLPVLSQPEMDAEDVVKARQAGLRDLGGAFKSIRDELRKSEPQVTSIQQSATQLDELAQQLNFWFPAGSGPQPDIETEAKKDIWERPEEFKQAIENLLKEAAVMDKASKSSDLTAVRKQLTHLGKSCKGCHDSFREEED